MLKPLLKNVREGRGVEVLSAAEAEECRRNIRPGVVTVTGTAAECNTSYEG